MVSLPLKWFVSRLRRQMTKMIRPPTATTRRKQRSIEQQIPMEVFLHLLKPFDTGDLKDLEWLGDYQEMGLKPTRETGAFKEYKYAVCRPSQLGLLWDMQSWDSPCSRRGHNASRLHLSLAAQSRGLTSGLLAAVSGNVTLRLRAPLEEATMPTLKMEFNVSTKDNFNRVIWGSTYGDQTAAALRNMMKSDMAAMIADPLFPTAALTTAAPSSSVWAPPVAQTPVMLLLEN